MKHCLQKALATSLLLLAFFVSWSQDIPLFSQKLTNSFIYNPAMAGQSLGSLTYSYRRNYSGVSGAPENHFLSLHTPLAKYRFGTGINVYQEDVNFLRNTFASVAFAYHIKFDRFSMLSFGVSGEYNTIRLNGATNTPGAISDPEYIRLSNGTVNDIDFSFGVHYQNRFVKVGLAANRLATAWIKDETKTVLSNYYSGYVQGMIPLREGQDLLEPYVAFRKFSESNDTYDVGLYYTYNNRVTLGAATRRGKVVNGTLGLRLTPNLLLGYSREMILGNVGGFVGSANEFTLRLDFNRESEKQHFSSDYKSALSYRNKTLSSNSKPGGRSPKQLHKRQKKLAPYSPNRRYQNMKKLSTTQKKSYSTSKKKKRKVSSYQRKHKKKRRH